MSRRRRASALAPTAAATSETPTSPNATRISSGGATSSTPRTGGPAREPDGRDPVNFLNDPAVRTLATAVLLLSSCRPPAPAATNPLPERRAISLEAICQHV